jgi:hypothetical protein
MRELEGLARNENLHFEQRVDRVAGGCDVDAGEGGDPIKPSLPAEDRDGARDRHGGRRQPRQREDRRAGNRARSDPGDVVGRVRGWLDAVGAHDSQQLVDEEGHATSGTSASVDEAIVGHPQAPGHQLPDAVATERRRFDDLHARTREELLDDRRIGFRVPGANSREDTHGQAFEAPRQVHEELERWNVTPMHVVDDEEQRRPIGKVGRQPVEPVHDCRLLAGLRLLTRSDDGPGEGRSTGQQLVALCGGRTDDNRLEQLTRRAETEVAFQRRTLRGGDDHSFGSRHAAGLVEQRRLSDSCRALDDQHPAVARNRRPDRRLDSSQLRVPLDERCSQPHEENRIARDREPLPGAPGGNRPHCARSPGKDGGRSPVTARATNADDAPCMDEPTRKMTLELHRGSDPISGVVSDDDGTRPFTGWLELAAELRAAAAAADLDACD